VITKGAARMAEVGARFALDGMPGKQLAIDSDMSAGAIDHEEAKARREREQQETTFFGSLDGASKFVKGDAIAGLLITLLNLVMGLIMGTSCTTCRWRPRSRPTPSSPSATGWSRRSRR
jgi:flagellar biosynthesis protein FlhA